MKAYFLFGQLAFQGVVELMYGEKVHQQNGHHHCLSGY